MCRHAGGQEQRSNCGAVQCHAGPTLNFVPQASCIMNTAMTFVDQEEALSFSVWVAELESLVENARDNRRVDPIHSFEILQKLQGSVRRSERAQFQS